MGTRRQSRSEPPNKITQRISQGKASKANLLARGLKGRPELAAVVKHDRLDELQAADRQRNVDPLVEEVERLLNASLAHLLRRLGATTDNLAVCVEC